VNGKDNVGGFSGKIDNSIASPVTKSSFSGTVTGENFVGGFCGYLYGDISLSSSSSQTEGLESIGGFAGFFVSGEIKNSYSIGTVKGNGLISGFVGELGDSGSIENSYASATVITDKTNMGKGGLVGGEQTTCTIYNNEGGLDSWPMVIKSFFNSDLFQYSLEYYDECGKPLSTEEMKKESTFTDAQWDFEDIWDITEDETFPFFR
jgi:hypothetical protein